MGTTKTSSWRSTPRARAGGGLAVLGSVLITMAMIIAFAAVPTGVALADAPQQTVNYYFQFYHPSDGTYSVLSGSVGPGGVSETNELTVFVNGTDWDGTPNVNMVLHLSCSDSWSVNQGDVGYYSDNPSATQGPDPTLHPDWEVVTWYIEKVKEVGNPEPCGTPPTTTTTAPTTTTSTTTSTTTTSTTTTTVAGPTTTTTSTSTTTTTVPDTTTTSVVAGPTTTTTLAQTTTTVAGPCDPAEEDCLPNTGGTGNMIAVLLAGIGLLLLGSGLIVLADERRRVMVA
ncbi:MAG TPA: hypothetical protein VK960_07475 [Acidimicrobiia bacterium]|nr:hypothetical protein [Acidimicrobiia bacterium]